jgi:hypothetical protein
MKKAGNAGLFRYRVPLDDQARVSRLPAQAP